MFCYSCHKHCWIYSHNAIAFPGGPSRYHIKEPKKWVEGGYICGNKVRSAPFYDYRKLICGDYIEPQYYNHNDGTKVRRIVSIEICVILFEDDYIVSQYEIKNKKNVGGKWPLHIYRYYLNSNIKVPLTNGVCNRMGKKQQKKRVRKKKPEHAISRGNKNIRKIKVVKT